MRYKSGKDASKVKAMSNHGCSPTKYLLPSAVLTPPIGIMTLNELPKKALPFVVLSTLAWSTKLKSFMAKASLKDERRS